MYQLKATQLNSSGSNVNCTPIGGVNYSIGTVFTEGLI